MFTYKDMVICIFRYKDRYSTIRVNASDVGIQQRGNKMGEGDKTEGLGLNKKMA